jgi:hypothetical protein
MHLLQQIFLLIGMGLITPGQAPDDGTIDRACLGIQCVLSAPIHRVLSLASIWIVSNGDRFLTLDSRLLSPTAEEYNLAQDP